MRRRWIAWLVLGTAGLLLAGRAVTGWLVDYEWYAALGAADAFWARTANLAILRGTAFLAGTLLVFANLYTVRHSVASVVFPRRVGNIEIGEEVPGRYLMLVVVAISVLVGFLLALVHDDWISVDLVRHGETFRESDPYFQLDLAFWLYWLPLEGAAHIWALIALFVVTLIVTFFYALTPSLRWEGGRLRVSGYVRRHLFVLGGLFLLVLAWSYRLDAYRLLLQGSGTEGSFSAVDHRVAIPANLVLALVTIVGAMLLVWSGWIGQLRLAMVTLASVLVLSLGLRQLLPPVASRFLAPSDTDLRDRPYASTRAAFSRRAFDIDRVVTVDSSERLGSLSEAATGTPLWDVDAINRAVAFMRLSGRSLGAPGWELREGRLHAIVVEQPIGPEAADVLSHWGLLRVDAGLTGENGSLLRVGAAGDGLQRIPAALVADSTSGYAIVFDSTGATAAPTLGTWRGRLTHAWGLQNPRLLRRPPGTLAARVVQHRDVRERIGRLYPFLAQGSRVNPVVVGDSLFWAVHLYAASAHYPLSDPIVLTRLDVRYFRHAAVALANAHTGRVVAISDPAPDPLGAHWMRRFPSLFVPLSAVTEDVLRQLPPASDMVQAQARVLARFGRRGDAGPPSHLARLTGADTLFSYPSFAPYADSASRRLAIAYPLLDAAERLRGAVVSTGGADAQVKWVPLDSLGPRWTGALELLRRALDSAASTARPESGQLARGPVRLVAHGRRLVLFQTAYAWRADGPPAVRLAAAMVGDSVRVGRTLMAALGVPEPTAPLTPLTPEAFRARVTQVYAQMRDALARGDLARFGAAFDELGKLLRASQPP